MTRARIGWYVHHHGSGHLVRLRAIAPHLRSEIVCFSSLPAPDSLPDNCRWVVLDRDDTVEPNPLGADGDRDHTVGGMLHWAPVLHNGHRRRLTTIASTLESLPVTAFVVDVSAEVSLFVRLLGIPTILITQPGLRVDEPHRLAFRSATKVIAPWSEGVIDAPHLAGLPVAYVGGISRFDGRSAAHATRSGVAVLSGTGGSEVTARQVVEAETSTGLRWTALGIDGRDGPGWIEDPWQHITSAELVVSFAGQNSIADLAAAGARAIVIPQSRPFDEQAETGRALDRAELAVVVPTWPSAAEWPQLIERARALAPDWSLWQTEGAGARSAAEIDDVAITVQ